MQNDPDLKEPSKSLKNTHQHIYKMTLFIIGISLFLILCFYCYRSLIKEQEMKIGTFVLNHVQDSMTQVFRQGDIQKKILNKNLSCSSYSFSTWQSTQCNKEFLECFAQNKVPYLKNKFPFTFNNKTYHAFIKPHSTQYRSRIKENNYNLPYLGVMAKVQIKELPFFKKEILFNKNCHQFSLKKNQIYAYSQNHSQKKVLYEITDVNYHLDQFLVSNLDLKIFNELQDTPDQRIEIRSLKDKSKILHVAKNLSLKQMRRYCQFFGKKLMQLPLFLAASFLPAKDFYESDEKTYFSYKDKTNQEPQYNQYISEFPFTRRFEKSAIEQIKKLSPKDRCKQIYSEECINRPLYAFSREPLSYHNFSFSLGGVLEAMDNSFESGYFLKLSSQYFPLHSKAHRLGEFIKWNGKDHSFKDLKETNPMHSLLGSLELSDRYVLDIGFRCYQEEVEYASL